MLCASALLWFLYFQASRAIDLDVDDVDSIKAAAKIAAQGLMSYYKGTEYGQIPGKFPEPPYYWWESGAAWGGLIDYWKYTGDSTYNEIVSQSLLFQVGADRDFNPQNESAEMGNDDQSFWGMAALSAAESNFPNPTDPKDPSWLGLAQAVYNEQIGRWDTTTCAGGIRWQVYQIQGYDLKNSISNGNLFNMAARLARYTSDDSYAQWAVKIWDWMEYVKLISPTFEVYDNSEASRLNCTQVDGTRWSYNAATMLMGASTMFNYTNGDPVWRNRTQGLLDSLSVGFFPNGIMTEGCEASGKCNTDQQSFKAYLSRWMGHTTQMAPFTYNTSIALLKSSATAAALQCSGGASGSVCGLRWSQNATWDGTNSMGQQLAALELFQSTMIQHVAVPLTNSTGGTSVSNPTAGKNFTQPPGARIDPATRAGEIAAWFLTAFVAAVVTGSCLFMWSSVGEARRPDRRLVPTEKSAVTLDLKGKGRADGPLMTGGALSSVVEEQAGIPKYRGGDMVT